MSRWPTTLPDDPAAAIERALPARVRAVAARLAAAGYRTVVVGGGVRDALLGRAASAPRALATAAPPERVLELWPDAVPTGLAHGTVTLPDADGPIEVTTFRTEGAYSDARRPDRVFYTDDLAADLRRRDFTVNALAYDPATGQLSDECGGIEDLARGRLQAVGDARARLTEDALRALRAARLVATHGFAVAPETAAALPSVAPLLERLSAERVRDELAKLVVGEAPDAGFELLRAAGLLSGLLPELAVCVGVPQNRYHAFDVYQHTLATLRAAEARPRVRWAALCHDLGKPTTRAERADGEATFHGHAPLGAEITARLLDRLRFPRAEREAVVRLVREHLFDFREAWTEAAVRRFLARVGPENLADLFALRRADIRGTGVGEDESGIGRLEQRIAAVRACGAALTVSDLAVGGEDVMRALAVGPGPRVGEVLDRLLEEVLEDPSLNTRERLLERLRALA
jgi:tRNA nucleotidyltransferase (CCA-adding enzyme)